MLRHSAIVALCCLALASCGWFGSKPPPKTAASPPAASPAGQATAAPQASSAAFLSGQDLENAVVGKKLASKTSRGVPFTVTFGPGGTGNVAIAGQSSPVKWDVKGDVLCFEAHLNNQTQSECDHVRAVGASYEFMDSTTGALNNTYTAM
jgi:hypothetical protein